MKEIIFIFILAGGMIGSGVYIGLASGYWHLLWVFLTFFACFGFWEWHAVATTGMTVSQQVWKFGDANPKGLWIVLGILCLSWLSLMLHFAQKRLEKK